jgi:hypothetical protein
LFLIKHLKILYILSILITWILACYVAGYF